MAYCFRCFSSQCQCTRRKRVQPLAAAITEYPAKISSPKDVSGLVLWLRADLGVSLSGGGANTGILPGLGVVRWEDQSGTGVANKHVVKVAGPRGKPTHNAADPEYNCKATITFDNTCRMEQVGSWGPENQPYTVFIVGEAHPTDDTGQTNFIISSNTDTDFQVPAYYYPPPDGWVAPVVTGSNSNALEVQGPEVSLNMPHVLCFTAESAAVTKIYVDGFQNALATGDVNAGPIQHMLIGGGSVIPLNGKIAEIIIYNTALSDASRGSVMRYLRERYETPVSTEGTGDIILGSSPPTVSAINPDYGPAAGGTVVDITVNDSTDCTGATVGGVALTGFSIINATTVRGTTGAHAAGSVDVIVTNTTGPSAPLVNGFRYIAAPSVAAATLNYDQGQIEGGGSSIIISGGTGFDDLIGTPVVTIGGNSATVTGYTSTSITFTLPAHAAGAVTISVTTAGGTSGTLAFEYWTPASLTGIGGWWRANSNTGYTVAAGAGTWLDVSGNGRHLTHATLAPNAGAAVNGHIPPDGNGAVGGHQLDNGTALSTLIGGALSNNTISWALLKADTFTGAGTGFSGPAILNDIGGFLAIGLTNATPWFYQWDTNVDESIGPAISTGTWYLVVGWWDGTNLNTRTNGAAGTTPAHGGLSGGSTIKAFKNYQAGQPGHDGPCLELAIGGKGASYTAAEALKILKYCRQRYGLALT
jgi:hypothetical protein